MTAQSGNSLSIGAALGDQSLANEQRGLLDLIDKLQFAQLDNVKLPQIVVVGDQSAGKSSVLEAITGTPFPREAGACTRFATEIRLRRAEQEKFSIRIIPDQSNRAYAEQERLKRFGVTVDESMSFQTLMSLAVDQIAPKNIPGRFAAGDILVVEKRGPNLPLLTVIDLPGLVKNANNDQSADDIKAINALTDRYMKNSRTIILAVVAGNQDYVQAPVLTKAREFDPTGGRTIGVLTKPDLTDSIGLEDKFIALVNNKDKHNHFDLGWYVLLNPGPREPRQEWPSAEKRKQTEDGFFTRGRWSTLPQTICGAAALKQKLSMQLQRHIGKHVRTLQNEIQKAHDDCMAELKLLGTGKDNPEEMREELVQLCSDSKDLVTPAVHGTYTNPPGKLFFPRSVDRKGTPPQKLRARTVEENRQFANRVRMQGQKLHFIPTSDPQATKWKKLGNITKQDFAREEVEPLLQQNTGTEFPMDYNPRLVYTLFQGYSENWSRLAQEHKDNLGVICNEFLGEVIDHIWPHRMREALRTEFLDPQMKGILENAQKEVDLLGQDLHFEIQPYDPEYGDRLKRWRAEAPTDSPHTEAEEVVEKMLIYYELSAKTFVGNVITQVVERHLLQGLHNIFSWVKINRMKDETVVAIAAEDKVTRDKRMVLKAKKVAIEEARDICANLAMRKELRTYGKDESADAEESSDEEESSPVRPTDRQQTSSRPPRVAGSSAGSPLKSQRPPSREERPQTTPVKSDIVTNGSVGLGHDNGFASGTETAVTGSRSTARTDLPRVSGGWNDQPPTHHYPSVTSAPQYAPPPLPHSEKVRHQTDVRYYPPSPPDSGERQPLPMQEQYPAQPSRSELNDHQHSNPYFRLDLNGAPTYLDNNPQSPARKPQRKSLGTRT
ncbi:hypothetical protein MMC22_000369 [Lobaria immixta]|nr:hypothetical protein [Lobaria immixta]